MDWNLIIGLGIGVLIMALGCTIGFYACFYSYRKGAITVDRIYHDKAPFDEETINNEPLDSHVDGEYMDEE